MPLEDDDNSEDVVHELQNQLESAKAQAHTAQVLSVTCEAGVTSL